MDDVDKTVPRDSKICFSNSTNLWGRTQWPPLWTGLWLKATHQWSSRQALRHAEKSTSKIVDKNSHNFLVPIRSPFRNFHHPIRRFDAGNKRKSIIVCYRFLVGPIAIWFDQKWQSMECPNLNYRAFWIRSALLQFDFLSSGNPASSPKK